MRNLPEDVLNNYVLKLCFRNTTHNMLLEIYLAYFIIVRKGNAVGRFAGFHI